MIRSELSVEEQIHLLQNGEAHSRPCDDCELSQIDVDIPPWFDEEKFRRGQKYIFRNILGQFTITLCGLICVLSVPSILKMLISTRKSSTVLGAYRRYFSTLKHIYSWYSEDIRPGNVLWKSLATVRKRHLRVSKESQRSGDGHISQRDLVLTQFAFFGPGLLKPHMVGMEYDNTEDLDGYTHFWRTIGYMLGIDDRYNLCRPNLEETRQVTQYISDVYKEFLCCPPEHFYNMVVVLLEALWYINITISTKPFIYLTYCLIGVDGYTYKLTEIHRSSSQFHLRATTQNNPSSLYNGLNPVIFYSSFSWLERSILAFMVTTYKKWMYTWLGRFYHSTTIYFTMLYINSIPFLGFWRFGFRQCFVDMFAEDSSLPGVLKTNKEMLVDLMKL